VSEGVPYMRVPISLPCEVPVLPGTGDTHAPIEERTELCSTDAWWMFGRAMICSYHLRETFGTEEFDALCDEIPGGINPSEYRPWTELYRYTDHIHDVPRWRKAAS
jgi:hypothetical protein